MDVPSAASATNGAGIVPFNEVDKPRGERSSIEGVSPALEERVAVQVSTLGVL